MPATPSLFARGLDAIGEVIGQRDDVVAAVLLEQVGDPGAASAAPDEAQVDLRVRLAPSDQFRLDDGEGEGGDTGIRQEAAPRELAAAGLRVRARSGHGQ